MDNRIGRIGGNYSVLLRHEMKSLIVAACNGRMFGGGLKICPVAALNDGKLDVMAVECFKSKWSILKAFMMLMQGKIMKYKHTSYPNRDFAARHRR